MNNPGVKWKGFELATYVNRSRWAFLAACLGVVVALMTAAPAMAFADEGIDGTALGSSPDMSGDATLSAVDMTGDEAKAAGWKFDKVPFDSDAPTAVSIYRYQGDASIPVVPNTIDGLPVTTVVISVDMYSDTTYETIDVSNAKSLESLSCVLLGLEELDLSNNPSLKDLNCGKNQLTQLDLSHNPQLEELDCEENLLTALDISANTKLTHLVCYGNKISDTSALAAWAQKDGVTANIEPQDVPEYVPDPRLTEYRGADRYEVAHYAFGDSLGNDVCKGAIVVSGEDGKFADALTASSLSGLLNYPIVLVPGTWLNWDAMECLKWLDNSYTGKLDILVVGGPDSVTSGVLDELKRYGNVSRINGADRYELAENVYRYGETHGGWDEDKVLVTKGNDFPDALCIAPYAASSATPILIVNQYDADLDANVRSAIGNHSQAVVLGGPDSVSSSLYRKIDAAASSGAIRLGGVDRYEAARSIVEWELQPEQGMQIEGVGFATGEKFADALSSGYLLSRSSSVLMLVNGTSDAENAATYDLLAREAEESAEGVTEARIFGGPASVDDSVRNSIVEALGW